MNFRKRIFALLIAVCMIAGTLPVPAFATGGGEETPICTGDANCVFTGEHSENCPKTSSGEGGEDTPACTCGTETDEHSAGCALAASSDTGSGEDTPTACSKDEKCTQPDGHDGDCIIPPTCTGDLSCTLTEGHNEGCEKAAQDAALADCTKAADCGASAHHADCAKDIADKLALCDGLETCPAELHNEGCLKAKADADAAELAKCDKGLICPAALHHEDCEYAVELAKCIEAEGCEAAVHKDTCPAYVWTCDQTTDCKAADHEEDCPAAIKAAAQKTFDEMVAALPAPETVDPLDGEMLEKLNSDIQAIVTYALENGLYETQDEVTSHPVIAALLDAMYPKNTLEETWTETYAGGGLTGGTEDAPLVITVDGEVLVSGTITISSGYVIINGDGNDMLKRDNNFTGKSFIEVLAGASLTLNNLTVDGGAVWSGEVNSTLGRGIENVGVTTGGSLVSYTANATVIIEGCTLQNNGIDTWVVNAQKNGCTLNISNSKIINNNGGALWLRTNSTITNVKIAYNYASADCGGITAVRPCSGSTTTLTNCEIYNNYGTNNGPITLWGTSITLNQCKLYKNRTDGAGGAIKVDGSGSAATLVDTVITENSANSGGSGIYLNYGRVYMNGKASIAGNVGDNLYISGNQAYVVNVGTISEDVYMSWAESVVPSIGKYRDNVDLIQVLDKLHYEGTVANDTAVVPFVTPNGSNICFATIVLNGGIADELIYPNTVNSLPTPVKPHYRFDGWCTDAELTTFVGDAALTAGATYYAKFTKSGYNQLDTATLNPQFTMTYGENAVAPASKVITFTYNTADPGNFVPAIDYFTVEGAQGIFDVTYNGLVLTITPKNGLTLNAGEYISHIHVMLKESDGSVSLHSINAKLIVNKAGSTTIATPPSTINANYGDRINLAVNVSIAQSSNARTLANQDWVAFVYNGNVLGEAEITYTDDTCTTGTAIFTYDTANGEIPVKDGNNITVAYGGSINLLGSNGTITVNLAPKALNITGLTAVNRVYDGTTAVTVTEGQLEGVVDGDDVAIGRVTAAADKNVGDNKPVTISAITLTGADADKYVVNTYPTDVTVNITAATLTAKYEGETTTTGRTPKLEVIVTGFVSGESAQTLSAADYTAPKMPTAPTTKGSHTLVPYDGAARNYIFNYVGGTLTIVESVDYTIIDGASQTVTKGNSAAFISDAPAAKFVQVLVDGNAVAASNYTMAGSTSTKVTLSADYIKSLSTGKHTLTIVSNDGGASTTFTVRNKATYTDPDVPATGDSEMPILWITLFMVSAFGAVAALMPKRRKGKYLR